MLKLGHALDPLTKEEASAALDSWETRLADMMPSNERVQQAVELSEVPSLADFIAIYEKPKEFPLISDQVWPPNKPLVY